MDFITEDDKLIFGTGQTASTNPPSGVPPEQPLLTDYTLTAKLAKLSIYNIHDTVEKFHTHLDSLRMTDGDRLRPSWDTYFMVSQRSRRRRKTAEPLFPYRLWPTMQQGAATV